MVAAHQAILRRKGLTTDGPRSMIAIFASPELRPSGHFAAAVSAAAGL
jgi:hypothetical protein